MWEIYAYQHAIDGRARLGDGDDAHAQGSRVDASGPGARGVGLLVAQVQQRLRGKQEVHGRSTGTASAFGLARRHAKRPHLVVGNAGANALGTRVLEGQQVQHLGELAPTHGGEDQLLQRPWADQQRGGGLGILGVADVKGAAGARRGTDQARDRDFLYSMSIDSGVISRFFICAHDCGQAASWPQGKQFGKAPDVES